MSTRERPLVLAMPGGTSGCHSLERVQLASILQHTGQPTARNRWIPNVKSAQVEKPCFGRIMCLFFLGGGGSGRDNKPFKLMSSKNGEMT
jgi:hypothetical protein